MTSPVYAMTATGTWGAWNNTYTITTTSSTILYDTTWTMWNAGTGMTTYLPAWNGWNTLYVETEEQKAVREEQARVNAERWRVEDEARKAAVDRANELLRWVLDEEQKRTLDEHGWFEVISNKGRRWRIRANSQAGNVDLMPEDPADDVSEASYCAHPPQVPNPDAHLAQALTLITDEDEFTRVANIHYRRPARTLRAVREAA